MQMNLYGAIIMSEMSVAYLEGRLKSNKYGVYGGMDQPIHLFTESVITLLNKLRMQSCLIQICIKYNQNNVCYSTVRNYLKD